MKVTEKLFGMIVLFIAVLISTIIIISRANFLILDTDPSTYVIVVMLMVFALIAFSIKEELKLNKNRNYFIFGVIIFIAYILLLSYARVSMSFAFSSFGINALLLSIPIISFIIILFGKYGAKKLWPIAAYYIFASPLLLMPLLLQNGMFARVNADFVYYSLKTLGVPVSLNGITIASQSSTSISIASTCAPLGAFVALVMFLIPVAYLYNGGKGRKVLWITSGVALMLLFNFIRMFSIAYAWSYYGITQAVSTFHIFAGQILFYAAIIIMLLVASRYGMKFPAANRKRKKAAHAIKSIKEVGYGFAIVLILSFVAFIFSIPYLRASYISPTLFYNNISQSQNIFLYKEAGALVAQNYNSIVGIGSNDTNYAYAILNLTNQSKSTYIIASATNIPIFGKLPSSAMEHSYNKESYLLQNGVSIRASDLISGNYTFIINYFAVPVEIEGMAFSLNYDFFKISGGQNCPQPGYAQIGAVNYIESEIYNILSGHFGYSPNNLICQAYVTAASLPSAA
jgi:exosortase/archaeosortase family protein